MKKQKEQLKLEKKQIANAKAQAKVDARNSRTEARRMKTKTREKAGGAMVSIRFTEAAGRLQKARNRRKK